MHQPLSSGSLDRLNRDALLDKSPPICRPEISVLGGNEDPVFAFARFALGQHSLDGAAHEARPARHHHDHVLRFRHALR